MGRAGIGTPDTKQKVYLDPNLQIIFAVTLMSVMGVSIITPALPKIAQHMGISKGSIGMLITAFTIPGALFTPIIGVLSDRFGRKEILIPSLFLFGLAGGSCAFVQDLRLFLLLRFLQGIGGTALAVLNVTIISDIYSGKQRVAALGYNSGIMQIGAAGYPLVGGALAVLGWRYPFVMFFISLLVGVAAARYLRNPVHKSSQGIKEYLTNSAKSLLDYRAVAIFITSTITFTMFYGSYMTYFPVLLEEKFGSSSVVIGVIMSAMAAVTAITASNLSRLVDGFGLRKLIIAAFAFYGLGMILMPLVSHIYLFALPISSFGIGHGLSIPCIFNLLAGIAPEDYRAMYMSVNGCVFRLGQSLGPMIMGTVYSTGGINTVFFVGTAFSLLAAVIVFYSIKQ
jgi:ACDE family multidrug resistance protein